MIVVVALLAGNREDTPPADQGAQDTSTPSPSQKASSPAPTKTSATPDERVEVNPDDYIGRPKDDARHDLEDLGFKVDERTVDNPGDEEKDVVADVSPSGKVDPDETITLSVYDEPVKVEYSGEPGHRQAQ